MFQKDGYSFNQRSNQGFPNNNQFSNSGPPGGQHMQSKPPAYQNQHIQNGSNFNNSSKPSYSNYQNGNQNGMTNGHVQMGQKIQENFQIHSTSSEMKISPKISTPNNSIPSPHQPKPPEPSVSSRGVEKLISTILLCVRISILENLINNILS